MANTAPSDQTILALTRQFFPLASGVPDDDISISPLPGGGSDRQYWRLSLKNAGATPDSAIYMFYTDARPDNLCFISAADVFRDAGVSIPEIYAEVTRPKVVDVTWMDQNGNLQQETFDGLWATCVQHEIDHLNGKLFIDYLKPLKRQMITRKMQKLKREKARS